MKQFILRAIDRVRCSFSKMRNQGLFSSCLAALIEIFTDVVITSAMEVLNS